MADLQRKTANLVSMSEPQGDGYIANTLLKENDTTTSSNSFFVTEYIPVTGGATYYYYTRLYRSSTSYIVFYDSSKNYISEVLHKRVMEDEEFNLTSIAIPSNASYLRMCIDKQSTQNCLYTSQLPAYEPYGWVHSLRKLTTATEAVENPLYSDGTAITAYTIKGNTVQDGTPTPSNPVDVQGVGNKTANLLPPPTAAASGEINGITYNVSADGVCTFSGTASASVNLTVNLSKQFVIPYSAPAGGQGTVAFNNSKALNAVVMFYNGNTQVDAWQLNVVNRTHSSYSGMAGKTIDRYIIQIPSGVNADGLTVAVAFSDNGVPVSPFEPYGMYKIPISSGGVTTNIYLGSVQSTRRIKKIVYKGSSDENWSKSSIAYNGFYITNPNHEANTPIFCNIAQYDADGALYRTAPWYCVSDRTFGISTDSTIIGGTTVADWKAYLATLYANGTPLTLWHILATEETGIVNEPLQKIDTYADTLSNAASIPTTEGANTITVDTTVQPSEFTATWSGWHNAYVKEYDGSDWQ